MRDRILEELCEYKDRFGSQESTQSLLQLCMSVIHVLRWQRQGMLGVSFVSRLAVRGVMGSIRRFCLNE